MEVQDGPAGGCWVTSAPSLQVVWKLKMPSQPLLLGERILCVHCLLIHCLSLLLECKIQGKRSIRTPQLRTGLMHAPRKRPESAVATFRQPQGAGPCHSPAQFHSGRWLQATGEGARSGREGRSRRSPPHPRPPPEGGAPSCLCSLVQSALPRGTFSFNVVEADLLSAAR